MVSTSSAQSNLWTAAGEGDLDRVKHLVEVQETAADARDEHGYTALHAAVSWGHPEMLRYLTGKGGDINVTDTDGDTPLYTAESLDMLKLALELGADPKHRNRAGHSPAQALQEEQPELSAHLCSLTGEELAPLPSGSDSGSDSNEEGAPSTATATATATDASVAALAAQYTNLSPPSEVAGLDPLSRQAAIETNNRAGNLLAMVQAILAETDASGEDPEPRIRALVDDAVWRTMRAGQAMGDQQAQAEADSTPATEATVSASEEPAPTPTQSSDADAVLRADEKRQRTE